MSDDAVNLGRRHLLTFLTTVAGGIGVVAVAVPFLSSLKPSARAQALGAPIEVDVSKIEPGQRITVEWRGKPVYIVRRTPEALAALDGLASRLRDPESQASEQPNYAHNTYRSLNPEIFVVVGVCTHLGCAPLFRPEVGAADMPEQRGDVITFKRSAIGHSSSSDNLMPVVNLVTGRENVGGCKRRVRRHPERYQVRHNEPHCSACGAERA